MMTGSSISILSSQDQSQHECLIKDCPRPAVAKGYCGSHYARLRQGRDLESPPLPLYEPRICSVEDCERPCYCRDLCQRHHRKWLTYGDPCGGKQYRQRGTGSYYSGGYIRIGQRGQHQLVMEEMLGRALYPGETVHHKNGIKDDNDPGNLELRAKNHGQGQAIPDLLDWAHTIIERYDEHS